MNNSSMVSSVTSTASGSIKYSLKIPIDSLALSTLFSDCIKAVVSGQKLVAFQSEGSYITIGSKNSLTSWYQEEQNQ